MIFRQVLWTGLVVWGLQFLSWRAVAAADLTTAPPLVLVHYMPWFSAKVERGRAEDTPKRELPGTVGAVGWGWHWTMNACDPERVENGQRQIASHDYPMIGPYDSDDADVLEYHLLLMKIAGIDGVIADWYGPDDLLDYAPIHRNTVDLFTAAQRLGLVVCVCCEDQTLNAFADAHRLVGGDRVSHARHVIEWLGAHWFKDSNYLRVRGQPALLVFGPQGMSGDDWGRVINKHAGGVSLLTLHRVVGPAVGAFDWPLPRKVGETHAGGAVPVESPWVWIPAAFPRFHDFYVEGRVHASFGVIEDDEGKTFERTLGDALKRDPPFVQIATWNDWGEGTQIEPSLEYGTRDLQAVQRIAGRGRLAFGAGDLDLPLMIYKLRKLVGSTEAQRHEVDRAVTFIIGKQPAAARAVLTMLLPQVP